MGPGELSARLQALEARLHTLEAELEAFEARLERPSAQLRTSRLSVVDAAGRERVVAQVVDEVAELRLDLPAGAHSRRSGVLLFAAPGRASLAGGFGLQLWAEGDLVEELAWWGVGEDL